MLLPMLLCCVTTSLPLPATPEARAHIVGASLFKNGYAFVTREIQVEGSSQITISELPQATLGTFWLVASKGVTISKVVRTTVESDDSRPIASLDEMLDANVGRVLSITAHLGSETSAVNGKVLSSVGQIVVLQVGNDTVVIPKASVLSIKAQGGELLYRVPSTTSKGVLEVDAKCAGKGSILTMSLENGLMWAPAYALDISDPKTLTLTAKSTVLNDLDELKGAELRFVTGFPNVPWVSALEPLLVPPPLPAPQRGNLGGLIPRDIQYITYDPTDNSIVTGTLVTAVCG